MALFMRLAGELPLAEKAIFRNAITALISGYIIWRNKQSFLAKRKTERYYYCVLLPDCLVFYAAFILSIT